MYGMYVGVSLGIVGYGSFVIVSYVRCWAAAVAACMRRLREREGGRGQ